MRFGLPREVQRIHVRADLGSEGRATEVTGSTRLLGKTEAMWLPWKWGVVVAVGAWLVSGVLARLLNTETLSPHERARLAIIRAVLAETAIIMGLYSLWQVAGSLSVMGVDDAIERAEWIVKAQRYLPLPTELEIQRLVLPHPWMVKAANGYYAVAHVPALVATLIWGFLQHRHRYNTLRNAVALTTLFCLVIQLVPVAPPRMLDTMGFVDAAALYNQSVYSALGRGMAGQLAAMPSVHIAWAVIVPWFALTVSTTRVAKVVCVAHSVATWFVVVATANHFWLDGIVAAALFGVSLAILAAVQRLRTDVRKVTGMTIPGRLMGLGNRSDDATAWQASSGHSPTES